jgi:hypothetical protein
VSRTEEICERATVAPTTEEVGIVEAGSRRLIHRGDGIAFGRLLWVGPLAAVTAAVTNILVRTISVALFDIAPGFQPLALGPVVVSSIVGALGATIVFAVVGRFARRPIRLFRIIAVVVLLLSFLNPLVVLPGASSQIILTLEFMHLVVAAISVALLTTLARRE